MAILIRREVRPAPLTWDEVRRELACGTSERELQALHNLCEHDPDWRRALKLCAERLDAFAGEKRAGVYGCLAMLADVHGRDAAQAVVALLSARPERELDERGRGTLAHASRVLAEDDDSRRRRDALRPLPRAELEKELECGDPRRIQTALRRLVLHEADWRWAQDACVRLAGHADLEVRLCALRSLHELIALHWKADLEKVEKAARAARGTHPDLEYDAGMILQNLDRFVRRPVDLRWSDLAEFLKGHFFEEDDAVAFANIRLYAKGNPKDAGSYAKEFRQFLAAEDVDALELVALYANRWVDNSRDGARRFLGHVADLLEGK